MKSVLRLLLIIICLTVFVNAQTKSEYGELFVIESVNASFPDSLRNEGHTYDDSLYSFEEHYNDSSIAIFVPMGFRKSEAVDLVFYFHGWNNNIRKSIEKFELTKQFSESNKNAIFVFPEGPKNSPDSFGGKLENTGVFEKLVNEVLETLNEKELTENESLGNIILSGHSGAYRVLAYILNRGGLTENISEVYLFDAMYGRFEMYADWISNYNGRFVNIITPNGGTYKNSVGFLDDLNNLNIESFRKDGDEIYDEELVNNRIVFLFTELGHSEVINPYFNQLLRTSKLENK
ncbi:MAG: hypothetical protein JEY94_07865 [Melioribacteraceae bacterium]|nr:hypothetical protein [Melioribacteraceae bacterium]